MEFPMRVNSKGAIKEPGKVLEHLAQVLLLSCAEVYALINNLVGAHLLVLGVQDLRGFEASTMTLQHHSNSAIPPISQ